MVNPTIPGTPESTLLADAVFSVLSRNDCGDLLEVIAARVLGMVDATTVKKLLGLAVHNPSSDIVLGCVAAKFPHRNEA